MKIHLLLLFAFILVVGCHNDTRKPQAERLSDVGDKVLIMSKDIQEQREYLESRRDFCYLRLGGPDSTRTHKAIMTLLSCDEGCKCFDAFVESSNWPTVLYGLVGSYFARPFEYQDIVARIRDRSKGATVNLTYDTDVDIERPTPVDRLLVADDGYWLYYGETLLERCGRKSIPFDAGKVDFQGGGIPICFMDLGSSILADRNDDDNRDGVVKVNCGWLFECKSEFYQMWKICFDRAITRGEHELRSKNAEQPGAGQPATQPADKPPVKDQPSTPTSKDGPR